MRGDGFVADDFDDDCINWLTRAVVTLDCAVIMLDDRTPILFPRTLCLGLRAAGTPRWRKRKRSGKR